jgi:DNA ligase D-like protein (predicted 3'-phosphoesterase)
MATTRKNPARPRAKTPARKPSATPRSTKPANGGASARKRRTTAPSEKSRASSRATAAPGATSAREKLVVYRSKRDFRKTPEPDGRGSSRWKKTSNAIFVIQKHAARALHYDFRLEIDGVLKSWAVPKGPSLDPAVKRLAVLTEDHPLDYADFEGVIPPGEYGGGSVIVWDAGPFRNLKPEAPLEEWFRRGHLEVWLEGKKVRGGYALVQSRLGGQAKNWLLVKMRDEAASATLDPVETRPESVMTGRTLEQIAGGAA